MAKKRSPVHPAVALDLAIERASQLHAAEGEHLIPIDAVATVWKQSATGSGFLQTISSLKQFGLFEDQGRGEGRQFKLSAIALDILLHEENSRQRLEAMRQAALTPPVHRELWNRYDGRIPPQDASIRAYLLRQREGATFHHAHVDSFINRFRRTLSVAGLSGATPSPNDVSGNRPGEVDQTQPERSVNDSDFRRPVDTVSHSPRPNGAAVASEPKIDTAPKMREFPVTLPSLEIAVVRLPERLTERDFQTLVDTINSWKESLLDLDEE